MHISLQHRRDRCTLLRRPHRLEVSCRVAALRTVSTEHHAQKRMPLQSSDPATMANAGNIFQRDDGIGVEPEFERHLAVFALQQLVGRHQLTNVKLEHFVQLIVLQMSSHPIKTQERGSGRVQPIIMRHGSCKGAGKRTQGGWQTDAKFTRLAGNGYVATVQSQADGRSKAFVASALSRNPAEQSKPILMTPSFQQHQLSKKKARRRTDNTLLQRMHCEPRLAPTCNATTLNKNCY